MRPSVSTGRSAVGAYGKKLAERFRMADPPTIISRVLRKTEIGVFEFRCDNPAPGQSGSIPPEDAYAVALQLRDHPSHHYWEEGRPAPIYSLKSGQTCLVDQKRDPKVLMGKPLHWMEFHLSRAVFNAIAEDTNAAPIGELDYQPGAPIDDVVVRSLGAALLGGFSHPERVSQLFLDHVTLAVAVHVAQTYGGMRVVAPQAKGGLAPWRLRRATEYLAARLDGSVALKSLADECGLSLSHFINAFRTSTGLPPQQWLRRRRVEKAKALMRHRSHSLSEIALTCGFADQAHFTRVFTKLVGASPGAWRRSLKE